MLKLWFGSKLGSSTSHDGLMDSLMTRHRAIAYFATLKAVRMLLAADLLLLGCFQGASWREIFGG